MQDIQALGKAFSHQPSKEIIQHFKNDIYYLFSIFMDHFCPPGSGYESRIRIQIQGPGNIYSTS